MEFLKKRLAEILAKKDLDVCSVIKFLQQLSDSSSQSTRQSKADFVLRWTADPKLENLYFAWYSCFWKPLCASTQELQGQESWDEFLKQYLSPALGGNSNSMRNVGAQPYCFTDLVQEEIWKCIYETFGKKTVTFIFDKCLVLTEIDEGCFVSIGSKSCFLHKNLSKAFAPLKRKADYGDVRANNKFNPYQLKTEQSQLNQNVQSTSSNQPSPAKRIRLSVVDEDPNVIKNNAHQNTVQTNTSENLPGLIRWFKPSENVLKIVIQGRDKMKSSLGVKSIEHKYSIGLKQIHFVGILKDEEFDNVNHIVKESASMKFPDKIIPKQWKGLHIPDEEIGCNVYVNVFKISETFARHHNIHVKIKQRRRKRGKPEENSSKDEKPIVKSGKLQLNEAINADNNTTKPKSKFGTPYDPFIILETVPALYNKSSWSRWSKDHIMNIACSASSTEEGIKKLGENILSTKVGSYYTEKLLYEVSSSEMDGFRNILEKAITFHRRAKEIHKLVKSCLTFWKIQGENKTLRKEQKQFNRRKWRDTNPITPKKSNRSIEVIDLTAVSPDSVTPDFLMPTPPMLPTTSIQNKSVLSNTTFLSETLNASHMKLSAQSLKERRAFAYEQLKEKIPNNCVLMTLKQICHLSKLDALLGSKKNCRNFFFFLRKSVVLAGTRSGLQFGQLMASLDPFDCEWLIQIKCKRIQQTLFAQAVMWLYSSYILTILKHSFYITEVSTSRKHTTFYLREQWKSISENIKHRFVQNGTLKRIGPLSNLPHQKKRSQEAINARIRYVPKKNNDLRPILSLNKRTNEKIDGIKWKLILDCIVRKYSLHRIRDNNLIRIRWRNFLQGWQKMGKPKLYYVQADIQDAFPSVNMKKLQNILMETAKELGRVVLTELKVISKTGIKSRPSLISDKNPELYNASIFSRPCILQENPDKTQMVCSALDVVRQLFACLEGNRVRIGKHKFSFEYGLPQGWRISEALCNVYYGHMDCQYFPEFLKEKEGEFFTTSMDDYLFITSNPKRALKFLTKIEAGMPDYNCKSNAKKRRTNLFPRIDVEIPMQECEWINFCGWKFCLTCGHIMRDFSSYQGQDMASSIAFNISRNVTSPENFLISRMKMMLAARIQYFLIDPAINCKRIIIMNVFEAGLVFAFRLYAICRVILPNLNAINEPNRALYIVSGIYTCVKTLSRMLSNMFYQSYPPRPVASKCCERNTTCPCIQTTIPKKVKKYPGYKELQANNQNDENAFIDNPLEEAELFYIAYHAFILKLKKHPNVFKKEVLPKLYKMRHYQKSMISQEKFSFLTKVLGNKMPVDFENIKI